MSRPRSRWSRSRRAFLPPGFLPEGFFPWWPGSAISVIPVVAITIPEFIAKVAQVTLGLRGLACQVKEELLEAGVEDPVAVALAAVPGHRGLDQELQPFPEHGPHAVSIVLPGLHRDFREGQRAAGLRELGQHRQPEREPGVLVRAPHARDLLLVVPDEPLG